MPKGVGKANEGGGPAACWDFISLRTPNNYRLFYQALPMLSCCGPTSLLQIPTKCQPIAFENTYWDSKWNGPLF